MDKEVIKAYEALVPADQLIVDAVIASLYTKDIRIGELVEAIKESLIAKPKVRDSW